MQQRAYENQQDYIRQQERFVERFKAKASKAAQAQSIVKRLERLDRIEDVKLERPDIRINFQSEKMPGKIIGQLKQVSKRFGEIRIVENASAEINRGDKIALIGANGKGKSTLLRIIGGIESFDGERIPGHNVDLAFYAQHQLEALNTSHTILEEMMTAGSKKTDLELRTLLGCFLFSGDDVEKKITVLSGGEKARVALAKTITSRANFMLLDEPTNHLDIHSVELLVESLQKYEGTYVLVSHDRYFISKTANKIWEIEDGQIKEFNGPYDEWVEWKERMANLKAESGRSKVENQKQPVLEEKNITNNPQPVTGNRQQSTGNSIDKEKQKIYRKQQKLFSEAEALVARLQEEKKLLEAKLSDPAIYADKNKFLEAEKQYNAAAQKLQQAERQYETEFEKLMKLEG
jgi:ATP-binding cassette subfamily F protein 3